MASIETEVEIIKREVGEFKKIHHKLDGAMDSIATLSASLNTMLAVHDEKINRVESELSEQEKEFRDKFKFVHQRMTEEVDKIKSVIHEIEEKSERADQELQKYESEQIETLKNRIHVLEKWRWLIIGGATVVGFLVQQLSSFALQ